MGGSTNVPPRPASRGVEQPAVGVDRSVAFEAEDDSAGNAVVDTTPHRPPGFKRERFKGPDDPAGILYRGRVGG